MIDPKASDGGVGVASNLESRASAEASAMKMCRDSGGSETCHVQISYVDQCAVVALGDHYFGTAKAETIDEAARFALDECPKEEGHCRIVYSNCRLPSQASLTREYLRHCNGGGPPSDPECRHAVD